MKVSNRSIDLVAVILASGIALALNIMTAAAIWVAVAPLNPDQIPRLGENSTQVLTGWGGGILGVLGAYVGFRFGDTRNPS